MADFVLSLRDQLSGPAGNAAAAMTGLAGAMQEAGAASAAAEAGLGDVTGLRALQSQLLEDQSALRDLQTAMRGLKAAGGDIDVAAEQELQAAITATKARIGEATSAIVERGGVMAATTGQIRDAFKAEAEMAKATAQAEEEARKREEAAAEEALQKEQEAAKAASEAQLQLVANVNDWVEWGVNGAQEVASALWRVAEAAAEVGYEIAQATIQAGLFREKTEFALDALTKGNGSEEFSKIKAVAEEMHRPLAEVADTMLKFERMGFGDAESAKIYKLGQDMQSLGYATGDVQSLMESIARVKMSGVLQGETLEALRRTGMMNPLFDDLAKTLGKSRAEIEAMAKAGKITADLAIPAIEDIMAKRGGGGAAGDSARKFAETTVGGLVTSLEAEWGNMWDTLAEGAGAKSGPLIEAMREVLGSMQSDEAKESLRDIGAWMGKIETAAESTLPYVKQFALSFSGSFSSWMPAISKDLDHLAEVMGNPEVRGGMLELADEVGAAVGFIVGDLVDLGVKYAVFVAQEVVFVEDSIEVWSKWSKQIGDAFDALPGMAQQGLGVVESVLQAFGVAVQAEGLSIGYNLTSSLAAGITAGTPTVTAAIDVMSLGTISATKNIFGIHSPSKVFGELGGHINAGMAEGIEGSSASAEAVRSMGDEMVAAAPVSLSGGGGAGGGGGAPAARGGGRGGSPQVTVNLNLTVNGGGDGKEIAASVQPAVVDAIRQAYIEMGFSGEAA